MALSEHHATTGGSDTYANSTNINTPCSLDTALTALKAGGTAVPADMIHLKKGNYTQRSATDTLTIDGTLVSPIVIKGYNVTPGDLDTPTYNADGTLDTSNYPVIDYAQGFALNASGADYLILRNVKVTSAGTGVDGATINLGTSCVIHQCYVSNPSTGSGAACVTLGTNCVAEGNNFALTGASGTAACLVTSTTGNRVIANIFIDGPGVGMTIAGGGHVVLFNVFFTALVGPAIDVTTTTATQTWTILGNTNPDGKAIGVRVSNTTFSALQYYGMNHFTGHSTAAILSLRDGTSQIPGWFSHNRFRDNVANVDGFDNWKLGGTAGEVTTDAGDASTDYIDTATDKYGLKSTAAGSGAGIGGRDIGAIQAESSSGGGTHTESAGVFLLV